jgi:hypothetical protein
MACHRRLRSWRRTIASPQIPYLRQLDGAVHLVLASQAREAVESLGTLDTHTPTTADTTGHMCIVVRFQTTGDNSPENLGEESERGLHPTYTYL